MCIRDRCWSRALNLGEDGGQIRLRREEQPWRERADALGAESDLTGRLLAGDVENRLATLGGSSGDVEQEGGLPRSGLARDQHDGAGNQAAAENPVELGHPRGLGPCGLDVDVADRLSGTAQRDGRRRAWARGGRRGVDQGSPCLALAAPSDPLGGAPTALDTLVSGARWAHGLAGAGGHDLNACLLYTSD